MSSPVNQLKNFSTLILLLLAVCTFTQSCQKLFDNPETPPVDTSSTNPPGDTSALNIYVAGDTSINNERYACYWKNGVLMQIPAKDNSYATSIVIQDSNVYVNSLGTNYADSLSYWKNGVSMAVRDTLGFGHAVNALTVSGNDVYLTGSEHEYPNLNYGIVYWKNDSYGEHFVPLEITEHDSRGEAIAVSNNDVYIAGELDLNAVYWKNGSVVHLPYDTILNSSNYSIANSVYINNSDVYIAGILQMSGSGYIPTFQSKAAYWKNNKLIQLTSDTGSIANAIAVSGDDVYVAGGIYAGDGLTRAAYWKNGKLTVLDTKYSSANAITIHGDDVYIAGNSNGNAVYWKNETPVFLGEGEANAIYIADK